MLPELHHCEEAEDFFEALHVPFDPEDLAALRVVIMRRFGELLVGIIDHHPGAEDGRLRTLAQAALQEAYASRRDGMRHEMGSTGSCAACALAGRCENASPGGRG